MQFNYVYYYDDKLIHTTIELEKSQAGYNCVDILEDNHLIANSELDKILFWEDIYEEYFAVIGNKPYEDLDIMLNIYLQNYKYNLEEMIDLCGNVQDMIKKKSGELC